MTTASVSDGKLDGVRHQLVDIGFCCLLAIVIGWTYLPVIGFEFVDYDDPQYVSANAYVKAGITPISIAYALTTFDVGNWIPLTWLSLELDATLFGTAPAAFHVVNVLWHIANASLLYILLRRLTQEIVGSAVVAFCFGVHPLHVESVAWVSERKDVLSTFWLLVTLLAYDWYVRQPSRQRMMVVCTALALGLLAKSMLVTVPVLLLLLDAWPLRRMAFGGVMTETQLTPWALVVEKTPLFCLALADGLITILAQRSAGAVSDLDSIPLVYRMGNAVNAYGWYVWKTLWPSNLCVIYSHPYRSLSWTSVGASAAALLAFTAWVWWAGRKRPHLAFGWLWFVISLLPVIGLMQVGGQAHADRYTYVPHMGLFVLIAWEALYWLGQRGRQVGVGVAVIVVICCMMETRGQLATWRNSEALWIQALRVDADNPVANYHMGDLRRAANDLEGAQHYFQAVLIKQPDSVNVLVCLGRVCGERHAWQQAHEYTAWALRLDPTNKFAKNNFELLQRDHPIPVVPVIRPQYSPEAKARNKLGLQEVQTGKLASALDHFRDAIAIDPGFADAHNNTALALVELKRLDEAQQHFEQAITHASDRVDFRINFATFLEAKSDWKRATEQYQAVLRLKPLDVEAQTRLALLKQRSAPR